MAEIVELWSEHDQSRLTGFLEAIKLNMPMEAMMALNQRGVTALDAEVDRIAPSVRTAENTHGLLGVASSLATIILDHWRIFLTSDNSPLHEIELAYVWEHRGGSPRTLALLWTYVARRCGYRAHWLEMGVFHPVCIGNGHESLMVDSTAGALVSKADCREIFEAVVDDAFFDEAMFLPPSAHDVADEVLELRLGGATECDDHVAAYRHMRFHAALHHDDPRIVFTAALAAAKMGDHRYAIATLTDLMQKEQSPEKQQRFQQLIARIQARFHYTN